MALGGIDLNLLTALKVLLEEVNVTRAGRRLRLSQPAMSGALAKLRRRFDDELLTRTGRDYELTPLAAELLPQVQETLRLINRALLLEEEFDPATSEREFRFTMSDYAIAVMHDHLLARVGELAPHIRLKVDPFPPDVRSSERVLVDYDVLIGPFGYDFFGRSRPLWRDRFVCLVDRGNPRLTDEGLLTLQDVAELPHAVAGFGPGILTPVDRMFGELGLGRRIGMQVAGWLPLPYVIEGTDMVAMVPERLARLHGRPSGPLVAVPPPFGEVVMTEGYWFAATRMSDPAHRWLFERLDAILDEYATGYEYVEPEGSDGHARPSRRELIRYGAQECAGRFGHLDDDALLWLAATRITLALWRNTPVENWHAGRSPLHDGTMMRINAATTRLVRSMLSFDHVDWVAVGLAVVDPSRVLPTGQSVLDLGLACHNPDDPAHEDDPRDDLAEMAQDAIGWGRAYRLHEQEFGLRTLIEFFCAFDNGWFGAPSWGRIVDRFVAAVGDREHGHWRLHRDEPWFDEWFTSRPADIADNAELRRLLLAGPDLLSEAAADWCVEGAIRYVCQDDHAKGCERCAVPLATESSV